tara:strand:- start:466 stop:636 length:171 start_codon:yes stop_codon:yes gene_type:complete
MGNNEYLVYKDSKNKWRLISSQKNWQIPNNTIVKVFANHGQAMNFIRSELNVAKSN